MDKNKQLDDVLRRNHLQQEQATLLALYEARGKVFPKTVDNSNTISNPISDVNIYRVTTVCHKSVNNIWSYKAKIYFRKGQTKAIHEITSTSGMNSLIKEVRKQMEILKKS